MRSYVVVGGGLAGLTAANALAGKGDQVILLEQSHQLGGRAQTRQQDGYFLNLGPHALYRGGVANKTFQDWKIPFSGQAPPVGSRAYFVRGNTLFPAVKDFGSLLATRLFGLREKFEAARLFGLFTSGKAAEGETMQDWIERHAHSQQVRDFAAMVIRTATYAAEMQSLSAEAALRQVAMAFKDSVLYLDGGWQTLIDGLAERALSLGVEIRREESVDTLDAIDADGILLAVGPASVEKLTGARISGRHAVRMASLDLALEKLPDDSALVAFAIDRPLYLSVHSASARLAPQDGALVHIGKYLGSSAADPSSVREELEDYAMLAIPQWRRHAKHVRFLPNLTVTSMMPTPSGRPDVDFLGRENIAVAGDWVGGSGMLADAAVASACRAAGVIQRRKAPVAEVA